jgi:membrane associated rhomboid family serine protease
VSTKATDDPSVRVKTAEGEVSVKLGEFEELVRRGQVEPATPIRFPLVTGDRWVAAQELEIFRGLYSPERIVFQDQFNLRRFPMATALFVVANVVVFLFIQHARLWYGDEAPLVLGAKAAPLMEEAGQLWRVLTFSFIHADEFHLLSNMGFLLLLGLALENAYSRRSYLVILAASGVSSGIFSYLLTEQPSAGASGMVFGMLGALVVFGVKYRTLIPSPYAYYFGWSVLPLLLITIYVGWTQPLVDNWGHVGGLVGGLVASRLLPAELLENKAITPSGWALAAAALIVLVLISVFGPPVLARLTLGSQQYRDNWGLSVSFPNTWSHQEYDDYGYVLFRHGSYPYVRLVTGSVTRELPPEPHHALSRRLRQEVLEAEARGELDEVSRFRRRRLRLDGHPAEVAAYTYRVGRRRYYRELYVATAGRQEAILSLATLEVWRRAYGPVFSKVVGSFRLARQGPVTEPARPPSLPSPAPSTLGPGPLPSPRIADLSGFYR